MIAAGLPAGGVYVGTIGGRGVTLTCAHVAKIGIVSAGGADQIEVTVDQDGYDLAAVFTEPLSVPAIRLGAVPSQGDMLTITGYPNGRLTSRSGRMMGRDSPGNGQRWGGLRVGVPSQNGNSGGPVTNPGGELVGILWATWPTMSAVVPTEAIEAFLTRLRAKHGSRNSDEVVGLHDAPPFGPIRLPLAEVDRPPVAKEEPPPPGPSLDELIAKEVKAVWAAQAAREERVQPEEPAGAVASDSQSPLSSPATAGLLDAAIGTAAPSLLTALLPVLVAATGVGALPTGAYVAIKVLPMLARWRRGKKTRAAAAGLAGIVETQPPREPPKARPVVPATTGESQAVTEESPSPEAVYNINYRPQPVDPGLLRMRRAFQRTSEEYPAAMPWVKRFEAIYELLLSGELK